MHFVVPPCWSTSLFTKDAAIPPQVPSDFYSYLQGQPLSSAASARFAGSAAAVLAVAAGVAAVLLLGV